MSRTLTLLLLLALVSCRPKAIPDINLEMAHNPAGHHIISPGLGWFGIIEEHEVQMFYFSRNYQWEIDNVNPFPIPKKNDGLLGMGLGSIGVLNNGVISIYALNQNGQWVNEEDYSFKLPKGYKRLFTVKQEWELAVIAMEFDGRIEFYYFDNEARGWLRDETATFSLPTGIENYFSMGNMTIAVMSDNKLGLYYLPPEGDWVFAKDYVLRLPESHLAVIPFEPGIIVVMEPYMEYIRLQFYQLDISSDMWIIDETMNFYLT